jgi:heme-degrading monooxygenase HmoA
MVYLLIRHKVEDYETWKSMYDEHAATRKAAGSQGARLLRNTADGNEVVAIITWLNLEQAEAFSNSPDLHTVMQKAGVIGTPELIYLEEVEQTPA